MNDTAQQQRTGERLRAAAFAVLLVFCLASTDGEVCYVASTFVLLLTQFTRRVGFVRLQTVWVIGFLYTVCREGYFDRNEIVAMIGTVSYSLASRYVCAANATILLTWTLFARDDDGPIPETLQWRRNHLPAVAILVALYAIVFVALLPDAIRSYAVGRSGPVEGGSEVITNSPLGVGAEIIESVGSTMLPALLVFYLRRLRKCRWLVVLLPCVPILVLQIVIGTRYLLLFSVTGIALVGLAEYRIGPRQVSILGALAAAVLLTSAFMASALAKGFSAFRFSDLTLEANSPGFHYEGVIPMLGRLMTYCDTFGYLHGRSLGGILLFWIPRFFWPDKPTLMGYWLPRELGLTRGFSGGYSAAATFAADPFADFGWIGGLLTCAVLGLAFARVETWTAKTLRQPANPLVTVAAPMYGAAFFIVRSIDTTFVIVCGFLALGFVFRVALRAPRSAPVPNRQRLRPTKKTTLSSGVDRV